MQGHEVGVVMRNHRIVSNGRGGDEDVCCLSASPGVDLPQGGMSIGYVLLDLLVDGSQKNLLL
jgi:hypothetical protein